MTSLGCNVNSCAHNRDNCCCLSTIQVQGKSACECDDTCCGSFDEAGKGAAKNSCKSPKEALSVSCDATNCVFNDNKKCAADHINISGICACESSETVCASFQCK